MTKPPFIIVDGSSYLYRAFHALPNFTNATGFPTNAIYGVINMLRSLVKTYHPTNMVVVFDAKGKTFRHDLYAHYKANRPPMPEELRVQIEPLHQIIRAMRIPILCIEGVEADDVIGTLAQQASENKITTLISTGDKDLAQLVNEHITLVNTMNNEILDVAGVEKKFGVPPAQIIDYLTLTGDKSDNIPGVEKVGPKTAVKWLQTYGSLNNIIAHADSIPGKVGEHLRLALPQLAISRQLVTIQKNVALSVTPQDLIDEPDDVNTLEQLFKKFQFNSWLKDIAHDTPSPSSTPTPANYQMITTKEALLDWVTQLKHADLIAVDTETTSLNYMEAKVVGLSFAIQPHAAVYIPVQHDYANAPQQLDREFVLDTLRPILENPEIRKVGHNLKYDKEVLANHGIILQGIAYDTMLESYVFDSTGSRHDLNGTAQKYLGIRTIHYENVAGKGSKQIPFNKVPLEQALPYAAEDADVTLQLHQYFWPKLQQEGKLSTILTDIEIPLIDILVTMERHGVYVDTTSLQAQGKKITKRLLALEQEAHALAGESFNLNSTQQLQAILYDKLKLPILKKTPKKQPSTAEPILQELAIDYTLPQIILEYRSLSKLKSTYIDRLPEQINAKTGRIHTSFHQAVTSTGRLSSSHPNLQNIPIRTEAGRQIRETFKAQSGYKILAADYSQMELRAMAHFSQDPGLLKAFEKGLDIHTTTAADVFDLDPSAVDYEHRRKAKAINFGLLYGMSAFGLAKQIGVTRAAAQTYIDAYFAKYPKVKDYMQTTRTFAQEHGYVETLYGRRLYTPEINAQNKTLQSAAIRAAINAPLQGTVADIMKLSMIAIHQWILSSQLDITMLMQVHDELVFEVKTELVDTVQPIIEKHMVEAATLAVPLVVHIGVGNNWDEAH